MATLTRRPFDRLAQIVDATVQAKSVFERKGPPINTVPDSRLERALKKALEREFAPIQVAAFTC
jgi:hypothetical protein